jgi:hypothetical protein
MAVAVATAGWPIGMAVAVAIPGELIGMAVIIPGCPIGFVTVPGAPVIWGCGTVLHSGD